MGSEKTIYRRLLAAAAAGMMLISSIAALKPLNAEADSASSDKTFEKTLKKQGFPESYKPLLRELHELHPSWIFTAQKTGLDWDDVLKEECVVGRNLVHAGAPEAWKSCEKGAYDVNTGKWFGLDGGWVAASKKVIAYYLDPRNFINDDYIFMFENQSYNESIHTIDGVRQILDGTFMSGGFVSPLNGGYYDYAQTFMDAAAQSGVSPYHLASRCRNEQGVNGAPQSLGTVKGYENYFNFFDIQAYATASMTAAEMGCRFAMTENAAYMLPWTDQYRSIIGGSIYLGNGYITKGQDTLYLQKFDVADGGNGYYFHQYMTCVFGQANEALEMKNAYSESTLASALEFKIPVYENMPEKISPAPPESEDNNNLLKRFDAITPTGEDLLAAFDKYTKSYKFEVGENVSYIDINAVPYSSDARVSGNGRIELNVGKNTVKVAVTSSSGDKRTYKLTITRAGEQILMGDTDGNGSVDIKDALTIMNYTAGKAKLTADQKKRADVDGSGKTDVRDALTIMQFISGKINGF